MVKICCFSVWKVGERGSSDSSRILWCEQRDISEYHELLLWLLYHLCSICLHSRIKRYTQENDLAHITSKWFWENIEMVNFCRKHDQTKFACFTSIFIIFKKIEILTNKSSVPSKKQKSPRKISIGYNLPQIRSVIWHWNIWHQNYDIIIFFHHTFSKFCKHY